jgi:hypothetical protein
LERLATRWRGLRRGAMMGWRGQHNRDEDARNEWRALPLRERYDWLRIVITLAALGASVALFFGIRWLK